jgi:hypothetical protein
LQKVINGPNDKNAMEASKIILERTFGKALQPIAGTIDANVSIEVRRVYAGEHPPPVIDVTPSETKALEPAQQNTTLLEAVEPDRVLADADENPDRDATIDKPNHILPSDEPAPTSAYIPPIVRKRSK